MTPKARLEKIKIELEALIREAPHTVCFIPVGLVSMALFFVRNAMERIDEKQRRFIPVGGGMDQSLPEGDR